MTQNSNQAQRYKARDGVQKGARKGQQRGRRVDAEVLASIVALFKEQTPERSRLLEYLHCIHDHYGRLSKDHLQALAQWLKLGVSEVYEVASFYHHFHFSEDAHDPSVCLRVCDSLSCEMAGAELLWQGLKRLNLDQVRLEKVPCVGRCAQAPVAVADGVPIERACVERVQAMLANGKPEVQAAVPAISLALYQQQHSGYTQYERLRTGALAASYLIEILRESGLRGLGGAGFPVARKWEIVRKQPGCPILAVNIDEGEPGTFKDRHYLEHSPHQFLEGTLMAAWATGCDHIYFYIRDEYLAHYQMLQSCLAELRQLYPDDLPAMELRRGAGSYVCGEESAMIESIEGHRGMPRLRPPYLAEEGLFQRPTLEHNFETLYWIPVIAAQGAAYMTAHGRNGRTGLRSFSVSGRVQKPGVHRAPAGISVRELIEEYAGGMQAGHELYAYFPGGASGGILPARLADVPLDFDTLQPYGCFIGSAAIIVLSQQDSVRAAAVNAMAFFAHESCGKCTPCRVGTQKALELMREPAWDQALLEELAAVMQDASICGLGQAAPNPLLCAMRYFPQEFS